MRAGRPGSWVFVGAERPPSEVVGSKLRITQLQRSLTAGKPAAIMGGSGMLL
jgi:hypothetical protein